ncbi:hypothetical protein KCP74_21985 [Salmonella enterica subsp. enterica]|nr:hypothetical protein KCP74_21985 [Salmonella enterica subsp. enterica]
MAALTAPLAIPQRSMSGRKRIRNWVRQQRESDRSGNVLRRTGLGIAVLRTIRRCWKN